MSAGSYYDQMERAAEMYEPDDTLGPCGCVDYHMADCPLMTGSRDYYAEAERDPYYDSEDY